LIVRWIWHHLSLNNTVYYTTFYCQPIDGTDKMVVINGVFFFSCLGLVFVLHGWQRAEEQWEIRQMMRHLMEVMMVIEGEEGWARRIAGRRVVHGLLPLPSIEWLEDKVFMASTITTTTTTTTFVSLLVKVLGLNRDVGRCVLSFI